MKRRIVMNIIRIGRRKDVFLMLPAEKQTELQAAGRAFFDKYIRAGKLKNYYLLADGRIVTTWDFASNEEMGRILSETKMNPFVDSEIIPFMDYPTAQKV